MKDDEPLGLGQFRPQGHDWKDLWGTINYCYTQNIKALDLMISEKIFLRFFIVSLREMMTPGAWLI